MTPREALLHAIQLLLRLGEHRLPFGPHAGRCEPVHAAANGCQVARPGLAVADERLGSGQQRSGLARPAARDGRFTGVDLGPKRLDLGLETLCVRARPAV
jgi:hypothetical protein